MTMEEKDKDVPAAVPTSALPITYRADRIFVSGSPSVLFYQATLRDFFARFGGFFGALYHVI